MLLLIALLCVSNTLLTFLTLAAVGRLVTDQRGFYEEFHGAVILALQSHSALNAKIENSLSCLVSTDAALDIVKNSETGAMLADFLWHENSFSRRNTKLLCPVHGLNPALEVNENDQAVLSCGCSRAQSLPLAQGRISVEHLEPRADRTLRKIAHDFFPADVSDLWTTKQNWIIAA